MERPDFRLAVFGRDGGLCVVCGEPTVDTHRLMERRLWEDYLDNSVSLCARHHMAAKLGDGSIQLVYVFEREIDG